VEPLAGNRLDERSIERYDGVVRAISRRNVAKPIRTE
jgi:hypothetical protein